MAVAFGGFSRPNVNSAIFEVNPNYNTAVIKQLSKNPFALSCLTGILLVLGWPPISISPVLLVAFVPLFMALNREVKWAKALLTAFPAFFIWFAGTMYWIGNVALQVDDQLVLFAAFLIAPAFMSLPVVLFHRLLRPWSNPIAWFAFPFFWISYEFLHSNWDLAFTWLNLGFGLSDAPWLIGWYPVAGPLGGTLLITLCSVLVFLLVNKAGHKLKRKLIIGLSSMGALLVLSGVWQYATQPEAGQLKVAIVQANIDPYQTLHEKSLFNQVQTIKKVCEPLHNQQVDLVVGSEGLLRPRPEAPIVVNRLAENKAVQALQELAKEVNAPILTGFIGLHFELDNPAWELMEMMNADGQSFQIYNGALFIPPAGKVQYSTKNKLVPFMEKVPFLETLPFLEQYRFSVNQAMGSYSGNDSIVVFKHRDLQVGALVCLDAVFPDYARAFPQAGANVLAVISNDGWAGKTAGYLQNAAYANAVAASTGRYVLRSANTGESRVSNAVGQTSAKTEWDEQTLLVESFSTQGRQTVYNMLGDWLGWVSLILAVGFLIFISYLRRR